MAAINFVYFDLGNVLVNFSHNLECQQISQIAGIPVELVRQVIFDQGLQARLECGLITTAEFHSEFCAATHSSPTSSDLMRGLNEIFALNLPVVSLVADLTLINIPLGILSNTSQSHWQYVFQKFSILRELFPTLILSYEQCSLKPAPEIYEAAIRLAGVSPAQIFFTDDRIENIEGATAAGMDAVLFVSVEGLRDELSRRGLNC